MLGFRLHGACGPLRHGYHEGREEDVRRRLRLTVAQREQVRAGLQAVEGDAAAAGARGGHFDERVGLRAQQPGHVEGGQRLAPRLGAHVHGGDAGGGDGALPDGVQAVDTCGGAQVHRDAARCRSHRSGWAENGHADAGNADRYGQRHRHRSPWVAHCCPTYALRERSW